MCCASLWYIGLFRKQIVLNIPLRAIPFINGENLIYIRINNYVRLTLLSLRNYTAIHFDLNFPFNKVRKMCYYEDIIKTSYNRPKSVRGKNAVIEVSLYSLSLIFLVGYFAE